MYKKYQYITETGTQALEIALLELKSKKSNIIVNDQDIINVYEED